MQNEYIEQIKEKMIDFKQYYLKESEEDLNFIVSNSELDPHLLGYIFDKILNFDVKYRTFEKLNYIITFKYHEKIGRIIHSKLSFKVYLEDEINEEVNLIFKEVLQIFEKALLEYSSEAIMKNKYSLPNFNKYYVDKINTINDDINSTIKKIDRAKKQYDLKEKDLIASGEAYRTIIIKTENKCSLIETPMLQLHGKYSKRFKKLEMQLSYLIELYIDNYFSYFEHLLCLLYPMTDDYNEAEIYSEYLSIDWSKKISRINTNNDFTIISSKLTELKEIYRNRFAHGLFSREKFVNVNIPDLGTYPFWIGKKYCQGYNGTSVKLTKEIYDKSKACFDEFINIINTKYELPMNIINSGIPSFLSKRLYEDSLINLEKNKLWIEKYWYYQDNLLNMDW